MESYLAILMPEGKFLILWYIKFLTQHMFINQPIRSYGLEV